MYIFMVHLSSNNSFFLFRSKIMWRFLINVSYACPYIFKSYQTHFLLTVLISRMTVVVFLLVVFLNCYCMSACIFTAEIHFIYMYKNICMTEKYIPELFYHDWNGNVPYIMTINCPCLFHYIDLHYFYENNLYLRCLRIVMLYGHYNNRCY